MPKYTAGSDEPQKTFVQQVAPGNYALVVEEAEEKLSSNGNEMIKLKLRVTQPHFDGDEGPLLFEHLVFTASAAFKIDQALKALGKKPEEGVEVEVNAEDFEGEVLKAELTTATTNRGKPCNEIVRFLLPDAKLTEGAPVPPPAPVSAAEADDDDVPF